MTLRDTFLSVVEEKRAQAEKARQENAEHRARLDKFSKPVIECLQRIADAVKGFKVETTSRYNSVYINLTELDGSEAKSLPMHLMIMIDDNGRIADNAGLSGNFRDGENRNINTDQGMEFVMNEIARYAGELYHTKSTELLAIFDDIEQKYGPFKGPVTAATKKPEPPRIRNFD